MAGLTIKITGGAELERKLRELDTKVAGRIARQATRAGANAVLAEARRQSPVGRSRVLGGEAHKAGTLRDSLKVRSARNRGGVAYVVRTAAGDYRGQTFYGSFVEFGHKIGKRIRAAGKRF